LHSFLKTGEMSEKDFLSDYNKLKDSVENLELETMFINDEDKMNAVLEINPGAGGTESQDWAGMLMRMYTMWGQKNNIKVSVLNIQEADISGIKTVTLQLEGDNVFGLMKGENGVHRLVRISPFDSNAKRHTSFASVFVYPLADESIDIQINPSDVSWETFRSGGAGGQSVNKIETAVRLKHIPSGIVVENSETRSQLDNKNKALHLLKSKLFELELREKQKQKAKIHESKKKIEWGSQIRNYVFHPYQLVKDLRTGFSINNINSVMDGDINDFIKSFLLNKI
tara:strand:+ start:553 stop:1401 length:849 start_codon:yes stop_codon:yes gene_type:complete